MGEIALPLTWGALLSWGIAALVIPHLTAWSTSTTTSPWVRSGIAAVLAGATAVSAWAVDVPGVPSWKEALGVFALAVLGAAGYRTTLGDRTTLQPFDNVGPFRLPRREPQTHPVAA